MSKVDTDVQKVIHEINQQVKTTTTNEYLFNHKFEIAKSRKEKSLLKSLQGIVKPKMDKGLTGPRQNEALEEQHMIGDISISENAPEQHFALNAP